MALAHVSVLRYKHLLTPSRASSRYFLCCKSANLCKRVNFAFAVVQDSVTSACADPLLMLNFARHM